MRKLVVALMLMISTLLSSAQTEKDFRNEIGFSLKGFNSFGLSAKFEAQQNRFWRLGALTFIGNTDNTSSDTITLKQKDFGFEFGFGKEIRKHITEEFSIHFGVDAIVGFNYRGNRVSAEINSIEAYQDIKEKKASVGIGIPVGFNYVLKNLVNFSIEFEPAFGYRYTDIASGNSKTKKVAHLATNSFWSRVNTESLKITIAYRFEKRKYK